jgi:hypothetical protein
MQAYVQVLNKGEVPALSSTWQSVLATGMSTASMFKEHYATALCHNVTMSVLPVVLQRTSMPLMQPWQCIASSWRRGWLKVTEAAAVLASDASIPPSQCDVNCCMLSHQLLRPALENISFAAVCRCYHTWAWHRRGQLWWSSC